MAQCHCVCFGISGHGGKWCLSKDFPRAVSCSSMCSHRGRVHMLTVRKHVVSFSCVVATCVHDRARDYQDCQMNTHRHKHRKTLVETHSRRATSWPFTFVLVHTASRLPEGLLHLERGLHAFMRQHMRTTHLKHRDSCSKHHPSDIFYDLPWFYAADLISLPKGGLKREEDKTE